MKTQEKYNQTMEKMFLIKKSKEQCEKQREKHEKKIQKWTDKLQDAHHSDTSVRRRSNLRIKRSNEQERRDEWRKRIKIAEEWLEELEQKRIELSNKI